jgi:hypothetical protein
MIYVHHVPQVDAAEKLSRALERVASADSAVGRDRSAAEA